MRSGLAREAKINEYERQTWIPRFPKSGPHTVAVAGMPDASPALNWLAQVHEKS